MKVVIIGAGGMLGSALFRVLSSETDLEVIGTLRGAPEDHPALSVGNGRLVGGLSIDSDREHEVLFSGHAPAQVINCVGERRQPENERQAAKLVRVNAEWPHRLAALTSRAGARLIHISTDGVFSGTRGGYREIDPADADDPYGRSKLAGEVTGKDCLTLRTSLIGQSLAGDGGLIGWFLAQTGKVAGFTRAIFSGLPTVELACIIRDHVLPRPDLAGLYHVSAAPISKFDLLRLVAHRYGKSIEIVPDDSVAIDRSLDSSRFRVATGYRPPDWETLVDHMYRFGRNELCGAEECLKTRRC